MIARIIDAHHDRPGKGLAIGALTSQNFANFYLAGLDRSALAITLHADAAAWRREELRRAPLEPASASV
ncbi:MAG: hypothetical protein IPM60_09760 [Rhodospirillales bacterium]|nr:hypothetical protein [Rhodospirillales bacterium]